MCSKATSSITDTRYRLLRVSGVTLIELVVTLLVLAIIAVVAAVALRDPIRGYVDSTRRAQLTDVADTALRRVARDIRLALPNSVRVTGGGPVYLELLLTKTGGRYRSQNNGAGAGDPLDFTVTLGDTAFDTLGAMSGLANQTITVNSDFVVMHNLFSASTVTTANAYTYGQAAYCGSANSANCNTALITSTSAGALTGETHIGIANRQFPISSPGDRFQVVSVSGAVTYVCTDNGGALNASGDGTGTLTRVSGYTIQLTQPTGTYAGSPTTALLAQNVSSCAITYTPALTQDIGLVSMRLAITRANESVNLYHEVHINNIP